MPIEAPEAVLVAPTSLRVSPRESYDSRAWSQLVESDPDLSRLVSVLADYGTQYVDELAKEYLATLDKERLPEIVDGIVRRARRRNASPTSIARLESGVKSPTSAAEPSVAGARLDQRQIPLPVVVSESAAIPSATAASLAELAKQVAGRSAVQKAYAAEQRMDDPATVTSADHNLADVDDYLIDMMGKFAPDSTFLRKS